MTFHIITIFPQIFDSYFNESILKRAQNEGHIKIKIYNLRDWATDKHKTVDDTPYGGGAGMVMKIEPLYKTIRDLRSTISDPRIILLSAKGKTWNQPMAREYYELNDVILVCGRYEGVDERITNFIDEEISIGNYILTGGEIPAMALVDSITRLIPGVLGNQESLIEESFSNKFDTRHSTFDTSHEYPQYTRPEVFIDDNDKKYEVPKILLSGNHQEIKKWRENHINKFKR